MDSVSFEGFVLDPSKCSKLSMEEKREIVYEVSQWSQGAPELLQSWSRQEILQILCAEMGKERKYTGLTKLKIIENLLKVVSEKKLQEDKNNIMIDLESSQPSAASGHQRAAKRQRKSDHPNRLNVAADSSFINIGDNDLTDNNIKFCKNSACRAKLSQGDVFCKRCSCCICHQYDDNKDPSLWLICNSDPPYQGRSCGMSCHLECALQHEKSGIPKDGQSRGLDGSFYCTSCDKLNDLLGCWRKQMITARDTRRVDILCYRISLSQKLLTGTERHQKLHEIVNEAMQKLEADVGPLTGLPVKRARGIVNRLSSGQEVQRLCAFAVESVDSVLSNTTLSSTSQHPVATDPDISTPLIRFENVSSSSVSVVLSFEGQLGSYTLWHRKVEDMDYPAEPTYALFGASNTKFLLSGLTPATQYVLKVVSSESSRELGMHEVKFQTSSDNGKVNRGQSESPPTSSSSLSNPSSVEDENNNVVGYRNENEKRKDKLDDLNKVVMTAPNFDAVNIVKNCSSDYGDTSNGNDKELGPCVPISEANLPITPCKIESSKDGNQGRKSRPKSSNKILNNGSGKEQEEEQQQDGSSSKKRSAEEGQDRDFGYYVKVIRWLECERHIEKSFRQKFLTWYSLRATPQEVRIVKVFVDTLVDDPASLAGQLVDTFSDVIAEKRCSVVSTGLCLKLFH